MPNDQRTLSDADVKAIADALEKSISDRLVRNAGLGVMKLAWRGAFLVLLLLAVYALRNGGAH